MLNIKAKKVLRGCVIAVIGAIISFAVTAALKNHFNNGGMFKFAAKPGGEIGLADKATPSAQSVGGSTEIFLLPSGAQRSEAY